MRGPEELAQVEPNHATGDQNSLNRADLKINALRADVGALDPRGREAARDAKEKKRNEWDDRLAPAKRAALPPENDQQRGGQRADDRLAEQGEDETDERESVVATIALLVEAQIEPGGAEIQHARQRVFELGHPRDRFDMNRM